MEPSAGLTVIDYVVIAILLLIPLGIGVLFAYIDRNRSNREEYLLGGRQMSLLPITMSLFVTFQSASSLMGYPYEVYSYGSMYSVFYIGRCLSYIFGYFIMIQVMYPLRLTSLYEYLLLRYQSQTVRLISTVMGMLQTFFYIAVVLFAPALALQTTTSMPLWMSVVIVGMIGTVYTAIGGIKSVVWTDTFQTLIVFVGVFTVLIKGSISVGSVSQIVSVAQEGGRLTFDRISPDPRTRHSWWGTVGGGLITWLCIVFNQSTLQRISSTKSERQASYCFFLNIPLMFVYGLLLFFSGVVMYSYFSILSCDPIEAGLVSDGNQMIPFFVLHVLRDIPGMPGLFMSTIFSGSLSTISSGLNALAANTVEDLLGRPLQSMKESHVTWFTKATVFVYGAVIIGIAYAAKSFKGPITQMSSSILGACGSPIFGMFLMGVTVPWANKYGAAAGGIISVLLNLFLAISGKLYGKKPRRLPSFSTDNCPYPANLTYETSSSGFAFFNDSLTNAPLTTDITASSVYAASRPTGSSPYDNTFFLFDISYEWYGVIGAFVCVSVGLVVSYLTRSLIKSTPDPNLLTPFCRRWCPKTVSADVHLKQVNLTGEEKVEMIKVNQEKDKNINSC